MTEYLYLYSYADSIDPTYSIPMLQFNINYSLSNFYPYKFKNYNLSSDLGLYQMINFLNKMKSSNRYQVIVVDVGIFWRYYKWIYNPVIRIPGSTTTSYILGFWHKYKELYQIIYSKSIKYFFGPIFGQLYSEANILLKPKLGVLEYYFTWLMLAYHKR